MSNYLDEAQVEIVAVDYFRELGYEYVHGPPLAPGGVSLAYRRNGAEEIA